MAITFKLDSNNDLDFTNKGINFVSSRIEQTTLTNQQWRVQNLKTKLQQFVGDWYKDIEDGVPWFQEILAKKETKFNLDNIETIIKEKILEDGNEINSIIEYSQALNNRQLALDFKALDIEGEIIQVNGVFP